jgi:hypothetical protein
MFCPSCGAQSTEPVKFCKRCGTNLRRVKGVLSHGGGSSNWLPEVMMARAEIKRQEGITPEVERLNEVKDGLVTTFVGLGVMIFLYFFLGVLASSVIHDPGIARLIDHIWLAGLIPFLIGVAITFNGLIISKRIVELKRQRLQEEEGGWSPGARMQEMQEIQAEVQGAIDAPTTSSFDNFSVTESTTTHLGERVAGQPQNQPAPPERERQQPSPGSQERSSTH